MEIVRNIEELEALYDAVNPNAITKVARVLTPLYRQWIKASRFLVLTTVGPEGTDGSPRGDDGPVVDILDDRTLLLPDWRGNNRIDSLRNIVRDGRVSLMFMAHGCDNVVRVNGKARLTTDEGLRKRFDRDGKMPKTVIIVTIDELYFQCAKALMRSALWSPEHRPDNLPTAGQFLKEMTSDFDGDAYDKAYPERAKTIMW